MYKPHALAAITPLFTTVGFIDYLLWSSFGKTVDGLGRGVYNLWSLSLGVTSYWRLRGYTHNVHNLCTGCAHSYPQLLYLFVAVFKPFLSIIHKLHSPHNNNQFN